MIDQEMIIQRIIKSARVIADRFGVVASGSYVDDLRTALSDYDMCIAEAYLESKGEKIRMMGDGPLGEGGPSWDEINATKEVSWPGSADEATGQNKKREQGPREKSAVLSRERTEKYPIDLGTHSFDELLRMANEIPSEYGFHHVAIGPTIGQRVDTLEHQMKALTSWLSDHHTDGDEMTVFRTLLFELEKAGGGEGNSQ